jgi:hypothetical protein
LLQTKTANIVLGVPGFSVANALAAGKYLSDSRT